MQNKRLFWAAIIGNALDHYDTALYGLLAPVLAPLFFPHPDPLFSLILTSLLISTTVLSKPLGSLFFGRYTLKKSPKESLKLSLFGIGLATATIGLLPTTERAGPLAPLLLATCRLLQGFFAAGEQSIGNLYLLEQTPINKRGAVNSAFKSSTIAGILLASLATTCVLQMDTPLWRLPFLLGSLAALIGLYIRKHLTDIPLSPPPSKPKLPKGPLLRISIASSFTYLTYALPFVFFNHFIPHITDIPLKSLLYYNTLFLFLDLLLLPLFGPLSDRFRKGPYMATCSLLLALTALPLFHLLPGATLPTVLTIRLWIILLGLAYLAPLQAWFFTLLPTRDLYLYSGLSYTLGAELLGKSAPTACLFLYYHFRSPLAPALYITLLALATTAATYPSHNIKGIKRA